MIYINLCVDWEGDHFRNLGELKYLLSKFDDGIPVTHFICPSYFYKYKHEAVKKINSIVKPQDEIGLHIHCDKSLIKNVPGVKFKIENNYYKKNDPTIQVRDKILDIFPAGLSSMIKYGLISGRGVPLSVYSLPEIKQIIKHSRELLSNKLNLEINSFRAGGWLASDEVFKVLNELGFAVDSSAVAPGILSNGYEKNFEGGDKDDFAETYPYFTDFIKKLWGTEVQESGFLKNKHIHACMPSKYITKAEQPFFIDNVLEIPNNLGASDFASMKKTFVPAFNRVMEENVSHNDKLHYFMNLTCHQEGDFLYKEGMLDFFNHVKNTQSSTIRFTTVCESVKIYNKSK